MLDLKQQVGDYLEHVVQRVDLDDVTERPIGLEPVRPLEPRDVAPIRWRWVYGVAAAVIVLAVAGLMLWLTNTTPESDVIDPPESDSRGSMGVIQLDRIVVVPGVTWGTDRIVAAHGAIWVGGSEPGSARAGALVRIDAATRELTDVTEIPAGVVDIVADSSGLWALLANGTVVQIDPSDGLVIDTVELGLGSLYADADRSDLTVADGALWVAGAMWAARMDLQTLAVDSIPIEGLEENEGAIDMWLGVTDGTLWGWRSHNGDAIAVDMSTNRGEPFAVVFAGESTAVLDQGVIWSFDSDGLANLDTSSMEYTRLGNGWVAGEVSWHLVATDGGLWALGREQITRLDVDSGEIDLRISFDLPAEAWSSWPLISSGNSLWTVVGTTPTLVHVDAESGMAIGAVQIPQIVRGSVGDLIAVDGVVWLVNGAGTVMWVDQAALSSDVLDSVFAEPTEELPPSEVVAAVDVFGFPARGPIRNKVGFDITDILLFVAEYIEAIEQGTPEPLFDTTSLGVEEVLVSTEPRATQGGSTPSPDSERPAEQLTLWAVELEGADVSAQFGAFLEYPAEGETPEYEANIEFGLNLSPGSSQGSDGFQPPESLGLLLVSDVGKGFATGIAGLPPQAAVVAAVYGDGTRVWQRPLFGMALFNDATRVCQEEPVEGQGCAPMEISVLDESGTELLRIVTPASDSDHRYMITLPSGETYLRS